jgi:hypothetical protein
MMIKNVLSEILRKYFQSLIFYENGKRPRCSLKNNNCVSLVTSILVPILLFTTSTSIITKCNLGKGEFQLLLELYYHACCGCPIHHLNPPTHFITASINNNNDLNHIIIIHSDRRSYPHPLLIPISMMIMLVIIVMLFLLEQ